MTCGPAVTVAFYDFCQMSITVFMSTCIFIYFFTYILIETSINMLRLISESKAWGRKESGDEVAQNRGMRRAARPPLSFHFTLPPSHHLLISSQSHLLPSVFSCRLPYAGYFGGVSGLSKKQFLKINGFPNEYWGWGGEDDDIYNR